MAIGKPARFLTVFFCAASVLAGGLALATSAHASPAVGRTSDDSYDWAKWREFWSFKPVTKAPPPAVKNTSWVRNEIDAFILAKLEANSLKPAPEADKSTLIRRATFDLNGLPPSPQEIRAFLADKSPDAYEKVIERLLASPHYGERWGRHWLDVARYTPGRVSFPGMKHTSGDSHYRDYVVRAFNSDKPYDQFLTEQLAGDLLPPSADRAQQFDQIIAPAFLSIGAWFDMCTDPNRLRLEMVDEMINTTSKAFMGLSVACARCHDHKFDPIPDEDYYALGGVFRSTRVVGDFSEFWRDGRVRQLRPLAMPDEVAANEALRRQIDEKKARRWQFLTERHAELLAGWKNQEAKYREVAKLARRGTVRVIEAEDFAGQDNLRIAQLMRDGKAVEVIETQTPTQQWARYKIEIPAGERTAGRYRLEALYSSADRTPLIVTINGDPPIRNALAQSTGGRELTYQRWETVAELPLREWTNFLRLTAVEGEFPRIDKFRLYRIDDGDDLEAQAQRLAEQYELQPMVLAGFLKDPDNPWSTVAGIEDYLDSSQRKVIEQLDAEAAALEPAIKPYELIVSVTDQPTPVDLPVYLRGNTYRPRTEPEKRGVPRLLDHVLPPPAISEGHSGRLELAAWLTDPRHPLTSRVMANRIWHWHFGRGIVASTSDFGSRGDPPTHPELLDWLASEFRERGWNVKQMHRLIMTSSTYRMSSRAGAEAMRIDPENKLLSRYNRRRLEVEALYDAMVITTNTLVRQEPGTALDVAKSKKRMMYTLTSGTSPKGMGAEVRKMFPLFDCELSGVPVGERPASVTPAQALFWVNNPLVKYHADRFAERLLKMDKLDDPRRLNEAYMLALGRTPGNEVAAQTLEYLKQCVEADGMSRQDAWSQVCQALYSSAEFHSIE